MALKKIFFILLFIGLSFYLPIDYSKAQTYYWRHNIESTVSTGTVSPTGCNTTSGFTRSAGTTYACASANYVAYTSGTNAYMMTKEFAVAQGKSLKITFDSRRKNTSAGVIKLFYNVGGQCTFSTLNNYQNGWVEWGSITPNVSTAMPGGCTTQSSTILTNEICGGQIVSVVIYCPNASSTNWIAIDNIDITEESTTTSVPVISGATTYTENFTQQYWYGPITTTYPNARSTGIIMPYHSLKTSSDTYVYLWSSGAGSTLDHTGSFGDYKVGLYTGFEYCDNTGGAQIITKELNTSSCAAATVTLRFDFLTKYPNSGNYGYTFDENYKLYCPEVWYSTGAPTGSLGSYSLTWTKCDVNYYFPTGKWMRAAYKLPKAANLKVKISRKSSYIEYIDNIRVLCDDCSICTEIGADPVGEANPEPNTDYNYTVATTTGATYYKWVIRKKELGGVNPEATLYWGAPSGGNPGIVSGDGTTSVVINYGSCTTCSYRVMCIPYDANPGTFAAPTDACYAELGILDVVMAPPCVPASITSLTPDADPICASSTTNITAVMGGTAPAVHWWTGSNQTGTDLGTSNPLTGVGPGTYYAWVTGECQAGVESSVTISTSGVQVFYVNDNSTTGDIFTSVIGSAGNTGLTSDSPKLTLAQALTVYAVSGCPGDTIKIDAGTYDEHQFDISYNDLVFLGAGIGKTIFDHQYAGANTDYFMYVNGDNVTLMNMTLTGYVNQGTQTPGTSGQALTIGGATGVQLIDMMVELNGSSGASGGNGAITILDNSDVTIDGGGTFCNFAGSSYTGGIDILGANTTVHIMNTICAYNEKDGSYGGGILIDGNNSTTHVYLSNCRVGNNTAIEGGGIRLYQGDLTIRDCIIENNSYYSASGGVYGGGLYIAGGTADVSRSSFINNSADKGGAVCVYTASSTAATLRLDSCSFSGNTGTTYGPDLFIDQYFSNAITVTCYNNTFSSSTIRNADASLTLTNCGDPTISGGGSTTKVNTDAPTYTTDPSPPSFSGTCGSISLPVELLAFNAEPKDDVVLIEWSTATELNNDYFSVEVSTDNGNTYSLLERVKGAGTSNTSNSYSLIDEKPFIGTSYYRLKQTDFNGKFEIFDPVAVSFKQKTAFYCTIFPNPASKILNVVYENSSDNSFIEISDLLGNRLCSQSLGKSEELKKFIIDISGYEKGIYLVKISSGEQISIRKLIIN